METKTKNILSKMISTFLIITLVLGNNFFVFADDKPIYKDLYADMSKKEQTEWVMLLHSFRDIGNFDREKTPRATEEIFSWIESASVFEDIGLPSDTELYEEYIGYTEEYSGPGYKAYFETGVIGSSYDGNKFDQFLMKKLGVLPNHNIDCDYGYYDRELNTYFIPTISYHGIHTMNYECSLMHVDSIYEIGPDVYYVEYHKNYTEDILIMGEQDIYDRYQEIVDKYGELWKLPHTSYTREELSFIEKNSYKTKAYAIFEKIEGDYRLVRHQMGGALSDEGLHELRKEYVQQVDTTIDYSGVKEYKSPEEYIKNLEQSLVVYEDAMPTDQSVADIVSYIEFTLKNSTLSKVESEKKQICITNSMVQETIDKEKEVLNGFNTLLDKYEIDTNKNIQMIAKYNAAGTDITKGIKVEFEEGLWKTLGDAEGIEIVFDNHYHGLFISKSSLKSLEKEGIKSIEIRKKNDKYTIIFLDLDKKVVDKASASVQFSLPAENQLASIIAEYKGGKDNWGGQYNASNGTLEFMTRYSGEYSVLDKEIVIEDIGDLEDSQQQAIRFMVSKDYFSLDEDKFYPNEKFTRYDFTTALTKMFFALDREAKTSFNDVEKESPYYPYIASAETMGIAKGFEDGTFRGDNFASKQEIIAFCARTLADKKGYKYPEDVDSYLKFTDASSIETWAKEDIALAVKSGLIEAEGKLNPQNSITKAEGAEILYKLFMLLYDTEPVSMDAEESEATEETGIIPMVAVGAIAVAAVVGGLGFTVFRKKHK